MPEGDGTIGVRLQHVAEIEQALDIQASEYFGQNIRWKIVPGTSL